MDYAGKRTRMHPYVLISLGSSLAAGLLAGAIWARDAGNRGNQLAALLLAAGSLWSLCDVLASSATDAEAAIRMIRVANFGSIFIPPLTLHMLITLEPVLRRRYGRWIAPNYAAAAALAVVSAATDWMWVAARPVAWGFSAEIGVGLALTWLVLAPLPCAAINDWYRLRDRSYPLDPVLAVAVSIPALIATLTDVVLPLLDVPFPRVGSASLVAWGAVAMWKVYRFRDPILAPHLFAREILATLPDGVLLLRLDGTIRAANEKMAALAGVPAAELTGLAVSSLLVEATDAFEEPHDGRPHRLLRQGTEPISVYVRETLLTDDEANPLGHALVVRDLREVVSLRSRLITSGRLAAVGQLAAGIAHEINNPLAYVRSNLSLLRRHWESLENEISKSGTPDYAAVLMAESEEMIDESLQGVDRAVAIVRDVRGLAHAATSERESADVNALIDGVLRMAKSQIDRTVAIEKDLKPLPPLTCTPQELQQVFLNLVMNAGQAVAKNGNIAIATDAVGDDIVVTIRDDGCGISPEMQDRIFEPFFTTKPVGEGTGLGLGIALEIVRRHAGSIEVRSETGRGTEFCVRLPTAADRMEPRSQP